MESQCFFCGGVCICDKSTPPTQVLPEFKKPSVRFTPYGRPSPFLKHLRYVPPPMLTLRREFVEVQLALFVESQIGIVMNFKRCSYEVAARAVATMIRGIAYKFDNFPKCAWRRKVPEVQWRIAIGKEHKKYKSPEEQDVCLHCFVPKGKKDERFCPDFYGGYYWHRVLPGIIVRE